MIVVLTLSMHQLTCTAFIELLFTKYTDRNNHSHFPLFLHHYEPPHTYYPFIMYTMPVQYNSLQQFQPPFWKICALNFFGDFGFQHT